MPTSKIEKIEPKVVLHFMRHSIKENAPEKSDADILLSQEGREFAAAKFDGHVNLRYAHVAGSPRLRTQETGAVAATMDAEIKPDDLPLGKLRVNEALDFFADDTAYGKKFTEAYLEGRMLSFLVHESDALAKESGDIKSSTFSRMAANIAGIIAKNYVVAARGAKILDQSANPVNEKNNFERILVTHATVQESFLLKVVERIKGIDERDELIKLIGENGFGYTEGFDVTLSKENDEERIRLTYKKGDYIFNEVIPISLINEIAQHDQNLQPGIEMVEAQSDNFRKLTDGMFKKAYQDFSSGVMEAAPWAQTKSVPDYFEKNLKSEWFQGYVNQNPGKQLTALDIGCGVGDISRDLQKFGFRVTGVDYEQSAIDEANKKSVSTEARTSPTYLVGNALDLDNALFNSEDKQFDLIYEFSLIHHLDPTSRRQYIKGVSEHLLPGGKFSITCFTDTDTIAEVDKIVEYTDNGAIKIAKFSRHGGKGVPTFLLSESEIRDAAQDFFNIDHVEYIDVVRFDKDGNKLPVAKRIEVLMTKK